MSTDNSYTILPNLRVTPNKDLNPALATQRNNQNIGLGIPNYTLASLPLDAISKPGDIAWVTDQNAYYRFNNGAWGIFPSARPAGFATITQNADSGFTVYNFNVPKQIPMVSYTVVSNSARMEGANQGIENTSGETILVSCTITVIFEQNNKDGGLINLTLVRSNEQFPQVVVAGAARGPLTASATPYTFSFTTQTQLLPNDVLNAYMTSFSAGGAALQARCAGLTLTATEIIQSY